MPSNYPATASECVGVVRYKRGVVAAVTAFAQESPWSGTVDERKAKLRRLNAALAGAYSVPEPDLRFSEITGGTSGASTCQRYASQRASVIVIRGKLSVVTYLHEFAHALGRDERGACRWSINLFRRVFPEQYARCAADGHVLRSR